MNVEIMSAEQAKEFPQLILPAVTEHDSFDDFTFYAGMEKDTLCGMVVADPRVSAPEILSVGVGKKHTGKGIGEELLSYAISDIIHDFQEANLDGPNRIGAMLPDGLVDDTAVCNLLKKCGFTKEDEDIYYEATVSMIKDNPYLDSPTVRKKAEHKGFVSLQKADKKAVDVFYNNLLTKENYEVPDKEKLDKDVSYFDIRNGVVHGCVLYEMISEDTLQNVFVYQNEQDALDNSFVYLCAASAQKIAKKYPKDMKVSFLATSERAEKMLHKILPAAKRTGKQINYQLPFGDHAESLRERQAMAPVFTPVKEDTMVCPGCTKHTGKVLSCEIYLQKPNGVLDGGDCPYYS